MKQHHVMPINAAIGFGLLALVVVGCGERGDVQSVAQGESDATKKVVEPAVLETEKSADGFSPYVDAAGSIRLPEGFKQTWKHLGSWAVAKKKGESVHEMHDVYTEPATIAAFKKTGEFPDGAVLVKEVHKTEVDDLLTGHAAWSGDVKIWFVMIKDRKGRFAGNDHWGEGWGWALFEAKDPTKNVSAGYDTSCIACHTPVEDSDWVYTYGYPALKQERKERRGGP